MAEILYSSLITSAFAKWLQSYKDQTGSSNAEMSSLFETSESSIQHILSGYRRISEKLMGKIFSKLNLHPLEALQPFLKEFDWKTEEADFYNLVKVQMKEGLGTPGPLTDAELVEEYIKEAEYLLDRAAFEATAGDRLPGVKNIPLRKLKIPEAFTLNSPEGNISTDEMLNLYRENVDLRKKLEAANDEIARLRAGLENVEIRTAAAEEVQFGTNVAGGALNQIVRNAGRG